MLACELRTKLSEYQELRTKIAELKDAMEQVEDAIKLHMGEREELLVDGIRIRWTTYTANRLDAAALREQEPDVYARYLKPVGDGVFPLHKAHAARPCPGGQGLFHAYAEHIVDGQHIPVRLCTAELFQLSPV